MRRALHVVILIVALSAIIMAQSQWSSWSSATERGLEYRWKRSTAACTAVGCFKDLQFRNLGKSSIRIEYTVWTKGMRNPDDEAKETAETSVPGESIVDRTASTGGDVVRIIVRVR